MASDSESSTHADLSKIRKDYLKLSKAKLTKACKARHLDPYGTKAVLVDMLMKSHRKKLNALKSPNLTPSRAAKHHHLLPRPKRHKSSAINLHDANSKSHHELRVLPRKGVKPNAYLKQTSYPRRKRSKSTYLMNAKSLKLTNRYRNKDKLSDKTRRSSMDNIAIKEKKRLLLLSKTDLIKQCKLQRININGLRNRNDIINKIVNMEQLFKLQHKNKKKKHGLRRTKSEEVVIETKIAKKPKQTEEKSNLKQLNEDMIHDAKEAEHDIKEVVDDDMNEAALWMDFECDFEQCVSRKRLVLSLKDYEEKYDINENKNNENEKMNEFMDTHRYLLSDWHHILQIHFEVDNVENEKNFNLLYEEIQKYHLLCDIGECSYYVRNNQNREQVNVYGDEMDLNYQFMRDVLDNIHCFMVHSFDTGFRMRNMLKFGDKQIDEHDKSLYFDEEMQGFTSYFNAKRADLRKIRGMNGKKHNKYCYCVDTYNDATKECTYDYNVVQIEEKSWNECVDFNIHSMKDCNTKQMIAILNDYCFHKLSSDILTHYKPKIIQCFEQNNWNGIHLHKMKEETFVAQLTQECDDNDTIREPLMELYHLLDFEDTEHKSDADINPKVKSIENCNHEQIMYILNSNQLFDRLNNEILDDHKEEIVEYFEENKIDGEKFIHMKRSYFCQQMIHHLNQNRVPKLNHSLVLLYKELNKMDITHIEFTSRKKKVDEISHFIKERKRKSTVEPHFYVGHKLFYWKYYENDEWFVSKHFMNIKEEILDNSTLALNGSKWDMSYNKAVMLLHESAVIKSITCDTDKWQNTYDIHKGSKLQTSHLLSLILYTDYRNLSDVFRKSFTQLSHDEPKQEWIQRNAIFANWARYLRETVECFGDKMKDTQISSFYHGICGKYRFESFSGRFYAPVSSTTQLAVAQLFAMNDNEINGGIIMEFDKYKHGAELRYFNATLISNYSAEFEHVFIGGNRLIHVHNIHVLDSSANYLLFMHAIHIFIDFVNGKKSSNKITSRDYMIINEFCRHKASVNRNDEASNQQYFRNHFPAYINDIFAQFCDKRKQVCIHLKWLNSMSEYVGYKTLFTISPPKQPPKQLKYNIAARYSRTSIAASGTERRRRHSYSGSMADIDVIDADYLWYIFTHLMYPIHVKCEIEGIHYDSVRGFAKLLFVYKLNDAKHPITIDGQMKKELQSNLATKFDNQFDVIFIENALFKYNLTQQFYVHYILQILEYFFAADKDSNANSLSSNIFVAILQWKYKMNVNKDMQHCDKSIDHYFYDKSCVQIDIDKWRKCKEINDALLHYKCKNLCFLNIIASIFSKCEQIVSVINKSKLHLCRYFLQELLKIIVNINTNKMCHNLKHIVIKGHHTNMQHMLQDHELQKMKHKFVKNNWKIVINDNDTTYHPLVTLLDLHKIVLEV